MKQCPWWPFIPLTNYVSLLLHCDTGIGNLIFELLRDIINEHIEIYIPGEELIRLAIPALKGIIARTAKQFNEWDGGPNGNTWKTLKRTVAAHHKRQRLIVVSKQDTQDGIYHSNFILLNNLQKIWDGIVDMLRKARPTLAVQHTKLKEMQQEKVKERQSIETNVF